MQKHRSKQHASLVKEQQVCSDSMFCAKTYEIHRQWFYHVWCKNIGRTLSQRDQCFFQCFGPNHQWMPAVLAKLMCYGQTPDNPQKYIYRSTHHMYRQSPHCLSLYSHARLSSSCRRKIEHTSKSGHNMMSLWQTIRWCSLLSLEVIDPKWAHAMEQPHTTMSHNVSILVPCNSLQYA